MHLVKKFINILRLHRNKNTKNVKTFLNDLASSHFYKETKKIIIYNFVTYFSN